MIQNSVYGFRHVYCLEIVFLVYMQPIHPSILILLNFIHKFHSNLVYLIQNISKTKNDSPLILLLLQNSDYFWSDSFKHLDDFQSLKDSKNCLEGIEVEID